MSLKAERAGDQAGDQDRQVAEGLEGRKHPTPGRWAAEGT